MTQQPISARSLLAGMASDGIGPDEVRGHHLAGLYPRLRLRPGRADFARADSIAARLPQGGGWGSDAFAVIVETRDLPELAYVIGNVHSMTGLPVQIFHGPGNRSILHSGIAQKLRASGGLQAIELGIDALDAPLYNALFLDRRFFESLAGRGKFLVFQTDSLCCPDADFGFRDFTEFDYIGAFWKRRRSIGLVINGGCGGFSLRDWTASVAALERFPARAWPGGEDGFFAFHLEIMGRRIANPHDMGRFATQADFKANSFGAHQVRSLPPEAHERFLRYCPEIRNVRSWQKTSRTGTP